MRKKSLYIYCKGKGHPTNKSQKVQRVSRGTPLFVLILGARYGWAVKATLRALYSRRELPMLPNFEEAEWTPGPVQTGVGHRKFLDFTGIPTPKLPARS